MSSLPSLVESELGNKVQRSSHCRADDMITLAMDHHFKRHAHTSTGMVEQKMHCPVMVRAVGPNGTTMCNLRAVNPMTAYELHVCTITALAKFLPAPMISIRLVWIPIAIGQMQVTVYLNQLTGWIDDIENYDERFDPDSQYWEQMGPVGTEHWEMKCLCCGDITFIGRRHVALP